MAQQPAAPPSSSSKCPCDNPLHRGGGQQVEWIDPKQGPRIEVRSIPHKATPGAPFDYVDAWVEVDGQTLARMTARSDPSSGAIDREVKLLEAEIIALRRLVSTLAGGGDARSKT